MKFGGGFGRRHHFQSAARQGFRWYEIDVSYYLLRALSAVGLGANRFGEPGGTDRARSAEIVHAALDAGVNFIDTSNVYASGVSEEHIALRAAVGVGISD